MTTRAGSPSGSPRSKRHAGVAPLLAVVLLMASAPSRVGAYGGDTHYYLRFAKALEACFTWDEAHLIASADYLVDKNRTTTAEKQPFKTPNDIFRGAAGLKRGITAARVKTQPTY